MVFMNTALQHACEQCFGPRILDLGLRILDSETRMQGPGPRIQDPGQDPGSCVLDPRIQDPVAWMLVIQDPWTCTWDPGFRISAQEL